VFVRLVAAARTKPDAQLSTWWGERYCTDRLGEVVRPDGLGIWREGETTVAFCLEYDRGSEQLSRLEKKGGAYARLEAAWGIAFWLLVVVPGPRREAGARCALSGQGLAVVTTTHQMAVRPADAVTVPSRWAPRPAGPPESAARGVLGRGGRRSGTSRCSPRPR
jgi:Replication-relaxation